jgi:cobalt-precorrin-5B (C1)-methyltransferase
MWPESADASQNASPVTPLRSGLTTGSCATACAVAAARKLFFNESISCASITLPKGKVVDLPIVYLAPAGAGVLAKTIKDAGDDPDVTHGATVFVHLALSVNSGMHFRAERGVGTVTRSGLALAVGEPAINPVPRQMISQHLQGIAAGADYHGGFDIGIGIENGEALALKTMNPRLGILGGLSVLGTSGIVRPFSCSAYIASIHQGIDVAASNGYGHIAASTGNQSEDFIRRHYQLEDMALIEMGDFVGAVLKYLRRKPIAKLSLCGGFGKISKLAAGHLDLHSRASSIDFMQLTDWAAQAGANDALCSQVKNANTSIEALNLCHAGGLDLAAVVCNQALVQARRIVPHTTELEVWAINRRGEVVGHASDFSANTTALAQ